MRIGWRPGGRSRITVTSMSPHAVSASVRGIGVAVISSTSGCRPLSASVPRCSTPKRCCSSITTSDSALKATSSCTRAWVPTMSCTSPAATSASSRRRPASPSRPVSSATRKPVPNSQPSSVRMCCSARISVGAISATWKPFSMATNAASEATMVLPDPTSPCSSRCIGQRPLQVGDDVAQRRALPLGQLERQPRPRPVPQLRRSTVTTCGLRTAAFCRRRSARPVW